MATNNISNSASACYFSVYRNAAADNVTGDTHSYDIVWDTAIYDNLATVNLTTGKFKAPITGVYWLNSHVTVKNLDTDRMSIGYTTIIGPFVPYNYCSPYYMQDSVNGYLAMNRSCFVQLSKNSEYYVRLYIGSSLYSVETVDLQVGQAYCNFSGFLVYRT